MAKEFEIPNVSTQTPIGSHAEGFSFDSIMKEVDVIVNIKTVSYTHLRAHET